MTDRTTWNARLNQSLVFTVPRAGFPTLFKEESAPVHLDQVLFTLPLVLDDKHTGQILCGRSHVSEGDIAPFLVDQPIHTQVDTGGVHILVDEKGHLIFVSPLLFAVEFNFENEADLLRYRDTTDMFFRLPRAYGRVQWTQKVQLHDDLTTGVASYALFGHADDISILVRSIQRTAAMSATGEDFQLSFLVQTK